MGKIMEALFCVFYLIFTSIIGILIIRKGGKDKKNRLFGIMTLVLVFGDAFHLVPRIAAAINPSGDYTVSLGLGKLITSVTMTFFYLILYFLYEMFYGKKNVVLRSSVILLAVLRVALCFFPQNDWTGEAPLSWGIYRNIPFTILGLIMVVLFFLERKKRTFRWMYLAILLSFAFYLPVVLWADVSPMIGMLMLPKTCMYMWIVWMGYKRAKRGNGGKNPQVEAYIRAHYEGTPEPLPADEDEVRTLSFCAAKAAAPSPSCSEMAAFPSVHQEQASAFSAIGSVSDGFDDKHESKLNERIKHLSDSYSEYLLYLIAEKKMENAQVYKRAIVDKKTFSKIKNNPNYHPNKLTAMCLCVGAKLNLDETKDLLARAGYALSPCDKTDVIFSYFIENEIYDMIELDIQLEEHGLPCLIE